MIVLEIPEPTPSGNQLNWSHWSKKSAQRKRWGWLVRAARLEARVFDPPRLARARITIERHGAKKLDADNARQGCKSLLDSLKVEGLILDDTTAVIGEPRIEQHIGKARKTVIRIEAA